MPATSTVAYHSLSALAGAAAAISFASSHQVDIYAVVDQLNVVVKDISLLVAKVSPLVAAAFAAYRTFGTKNVPQDAVAVVPHDDGSKVGTPSTAQKVVGNDIVVAGKVVGALLFALLIFGAAPSAFAQQRPLSPLVANIQQTLVADLTAARDDAKANADPSEACWAMLLDHASNMPPKILGVAHTAQRLRDIRRGLPKVMETCAVVKDGAREAIIQIFAVGASGASALAFFGL